MTIKTILAPLDESSGTDATLQAALVVAKRFGAHIEVLSVVEREESIVPFVSDSVSGAALQVAIDAMRHRIREQSRRTRTRFLAFCARHRLSEATKPIRGSKPSASFREEKGSLAAWIGLRGRLVDLIVVPRPQGDWPDIAPVEAALLESGRPVLVVPEAIKVLGRHVAIGWNGSAEAAGAVTAAMPLLSQASKVTVLSAPEGAEARVGAKELVAHLAWHGIRARAVTFKAGAFSMGKALLAQTAKSGADLLVIGGYSHSRQRELIFGGVTRHVLSSARIPVLMLH